MANTYSQLTIHVIIAVQSRANLIKKDFQQDVYKYMTGIVKNKGHKLLSIGGVADHIHLVIGLNPSMAISDLVRDIKNNSTNFINDKKWLPGKFYWQEGYGVFSYSKSQRKDIIRYVENQEEHHKQSTFREEYLKILDRFEVDFDDKYIFEFFN
jgi:REP element-mobilizing transposase RayT